MNLLEKQEPGEKTLNHASYHDVVTKLQVFDSQASDPFSRAAWSGLLAKHGELRPVVFSDEGAAFALQYQNGHLTSLANWYSFSWRPHGDRARWSGLAAQLRGETAFVKLSPIPDEDGTASALLEAFRSAGWYAVLERCDVNHVLRVRGQTYAGYLADRPGKLRSTLKRKSNKTQRRIVSNFDKRMWQDYETIYEQSWKPAEGQPALLREFAMQEGAAGRLRLGLALREGAPVAAQFWTVENGTAYIHKLAHLPASEPLSAGTTLTAEMFRHVIDIDGVKMVDFGTGNDGYKPDWMNACRPRFRLIAMDARQPRVWPSLARHALRRLASAVRRG